MTLMASVTDGGADKISVLHVDDESDFVDLTATFLTREDELIDVQTATNANAGLEILAEHDVNCVVSDYDMPGRNGIEFLKAVRKEYPNLPFILFTGKGSEEVASEAISAGVSDYLQKESGSDQYAILANRIRNYVERFQAQREYDAMRKRMQLALEKTRSVIFETNLDTGVVTPHGYFEELFEFSAEGVPTWEDHLQHAVHPDDQETFRHFYQQLADGERDSGTLEYRTTPESGSVRWIQDTVHIDNSNPDYVLGIAQDITARKEQEQKRKQIIEWVTDAIVEVNADWEFTLVNEQAERLYDMDESNLISQNFWDVFDEARGTRFEEEYRQVMETREPTSFVEYFTQLDGWFDIEVHPKADGGIAFYFVETTAQHDRQHELEQTNALLSTLFETLPVGVLAEDSDRNVLTVNERMFELFELSGSPAEVTGADCEQLVEQISDMFVDPMGFVEKTTALVANRESTNSETLVLQDGRIFERCHQVVELPDGTGHLWTYQDMTEQREGEQQLREEQQFVKSIFNALPDPLYAFDTDGYPIRWNEQIKTITGYSDDEIADMHFTDFIPEDEAAKIATQFQTILEERRPVAAESATETKHGDRIPFEFTGAPLEDADGNLRGVTGGGRDITERKEHTDRLKALNERSQDLMTAESQEQIAGIGVDAARDILGLNLNAIHLYDENQSGLVPVAATDVVYDLIGDPPVFTEEDSIAWRTYEEGEALSLDDIQDDPDLHNPDTPIRSELYLPLSDHGILLAGSPTRDTFDQQDLALGKILAGNIASALDQRTQTEQLRTRERELTRQNDRLEEFASVVSHDLRNPLSVVKGRLELAQKDRDSEHLRAMEPAVERMNRIIEDVLRLAREGEDIGTVESVVVQDAIEAVWNIVADSAVQAELHYAGEEPVEATIEADKDRFHQLLENLLGNAIEHGGADVTVTVGAVDDGFYVEDDGSGIPENSRDDVFTAGYSTDEEGTGFGLSIVKRVVDAHDWKICVIEGTDGGARFEITDVEFAA